MKLRSLVAAVRSALANWGNFGPSLIWPYYTVQAPATMYPYYTVPSPKAMKVRFREGKNAREVLHFNLHLSPADEWSAQIVQAASDDEVTRVARAGSCYSPKRCRAQVPEAMKA